MRRRLRLGFAVAAGVAIVALVGAWAAWGDPSRWGCPSNAELSRPVSEEQVMSAFADRGLQLVPYRRHGAITTYRSSRGGATLYVNVCSTNCSPDDRWITRRPRNVGPVVFVRNLGMAVAGPRAAAAPLRGAVLAVADEFDGPNGGERCYIG